MWLTTHRNNGIDRLVNEFFASQSTANHFGGLSVYEKEDTLHVRADLPGVKKDEINLEIKDGYLKVSAERKVEVDKKAKVYTWGSHEYQFSRSVKLPYPVDESKVDAKHENGVLSIALPRAEDSKPKQILVN